MPVLPELEPMLARINDSRRQVPDEQLSFTERRELIHQGMDQRASAVVAEPPPVDRRDQSVPVAGGEITVRVYRPPGVVEPAPAHVYVHGGGWWLGTLEHRDRLCATRAANAGCVVVSVAHRLAPEHRYPVPVEDVCAALQWVVANADDLGIDADNVSIGGDSSGANLAAAATLMCRDRRGAMPVAQILEIPALDLTMSQPSVAAYADGYALTRDDLAANIDLYCDPEQRAEPYASPALAPDLTQLPPALIMVAEYDVLRDDGELYGRRLNEAGSPAETICWRGHIHGSHEMTGVLPSARDWQAKVASFLQAAHGA